MKFDLEKAYSMEPIEYRNAATSTWESCHFVGETSSGVPVIEPHGSVELIKISTGLLRMAPKKVTLRFRNYIGIQCGEISVMTLNYGGTWMEPDLIEKQEWFRGWIHTEWQTAEVSE